MLSLKRLVLLAVVTGAAAAVPAGAASAAPPSNDSFSGATVIGSVPFSDTEDTSEATLDADDTAAGAACPDPGFTFSNSVWYAYTPSSDQDVRLDTSGSSYSVAGAVVTGSPGSFSPVAGGCFLGGTTLSLTGGTTYYIDLLQFGSGSGGTLQLSLSESVAPDPALTVSRSGGFSKSGLATVSGTASCAAGSFAFLGGSLTQSVGRVATITGFGSLSSPITCDGEPHQWSLVVTPWSGLFRGGKAQATISLDACSFTCDFEQVTRTIQLAAA